MDDGTSVNISRVAQPRRANVPRARSLTLSLQQTARLDSLPVVEYVSGTAFPHPRRRMQRTPAGSDSSLGLTWGSGESLTPYDSLPLSQTPERRQIDLRSAAARSPNFSAAKISLASR
ncbi:hypothetical protein E4U57_006624 [Claviceps arundinis]|uniref:Uncharacterized protein n=1 Tax=Claviceps arundinis TaxID=1623583 RepID=A0ABQ7P1N7_9HYPO|nr:hypothetical protein E4U57_006624 [Claviceps arundinis]